MAKEVVGKIVKFFPNISVGVVQVSKTIKVGDTISIEGHGKEFQQKIASMQVEHQSIPEAKPGDDIGMKLDQPVKEGDIIYKVEEQTGAIAEKPAKAKRGRPRKIKTEG